MPDTLGAIAAKESELLEAKVAYALARKELAIDLAETGVIKSTFVYGGEGTIFYIDLSAPGKPRVLPALELLQSVTLPTP